MGSPNARFNEAAGFTQRKQQFFKNHRPGKFQASMRPPVLPSGNGAAVDGRDVHAPGCFNEAAGFTQRKPVYWPATMAAGVFVLQ